MFELNLPTYNFKLKRENGIVRIWDNLRRKYIVLTPEEWVRQHFVNYLISQKAYPQALMVNETQITLNNQQKRCDTVVYNRQLSPLMIIEYKSPEIKITQSVFDQIARYNIVLKVNYLIVSNGLQHFCCKMDYASQSFSYLPEIPEFNIINN
ncbi:hypothetical protein D0T53_06040 [Dysgonomonas sp. 216]|uniref:type I restriction enzyme HsdR N-terminal domain-containing protein n=1 Tax=Dysgonomonas sp. 216 TaxID=2302934 RepID=UPI0013D1A3C4|nr:type I restriction enzyme HsdR N-terminal domain-containing protein [Dysgonomonas sp. 216]NDW18474.1 hypothetical protein [Dysgonomonas sp. 216]